MQELSFKLDVFEGPLDLLLHLISKHKLDIYDIQISVLLEQYLAFIDAVQEQDIELAGEFLEMAARLIYIKTASLLPKYEETEKLKEELTGELIEYAVCKAVAGRLRDGYIENDIFVREQEKIKLDKTFKGTLKPDRLISAYLNAAGRRLRNIPVEENVFEPLVKREYVSVTSKIVYILRNIHKVKRIEINSLYEKQSTHSECVAIFLAILELSKAGRVLISDDNKQLMFNPERNRQAVKQ